LELGYDIVLRHFDGFLMVFGSKNGFLMVFGQKMKKNPKTIKTSGSFCHFKWRFHIGKSIFCIFQGGDPGKLKNGLKKWFFDRFLMVF